MNPQLTDDAVARLPLHDGRAELLEEIMRTPVVDDTPVSAPAQPRRRGWLVPVAVAAAVALLAAASAWWASSLGSDPAPEPEPAAAPPSAAYRAVLEADGWTVDNAFEGAKRGGEIGYVHEGASLQVNWYAAGEYDGYFEDRRHISEPASDGTPVDVLGLPSSMWAYSADDHTAIRPVENGYFLEIRGGGLSEQEYLAILGQLRLVDADEFDAALPADFVTNVERNDQIEAILDEIDEVADPLLPAGVSRSSIVSDQSDPYQLGAEVTGQITCAWIRQFADAQDATLPPALQAVGVMATARDWPVLHRMNERGDWPEWIWSMADQITEGEVPEGWRQTCRD